MNKSGQIGRRLKAITPIYKLGLTAYESGVVVYFYCGQKNVIVIGNG